MKMFFFHNTLRTCFPSEEKLFTCPNCFSAFKDKTLKENPFTKVSIVQTTLENHCLIFRKKIKRLFNSKWWRARVFEDVHACIITSAVFCFLNVHTQRSCCRGQTGMNEYLIEAYWEDQNDLALNHASIKIKMVQGEGGKGENSGHTLKCQSLSSKQEYITTKHPVFKYQTETILLLMIAFTVTVHFHQPTSFYR